MSSDSPHSPDRERRPVFVTGGTGFVGSHLVEALRQRGYSDVRCLVRSTPRWLSDIPHTPVAGDLNSVGSLAQAMEGCGTVFHVAAMTRARDWEEMRRANVEGTLNVLQAAASLQRPPRVQVVSSLAAVGRSRESVANESTPLDPVSMYGRSKAIMEEELRAYAERLEVTVVRPPAVYGPRDTDIYTVFRAASRGVFAVVGGSSGPALTLVHVSDLVRGMIDAAESPVTPGRTYFLGADPAVSWTAVRDAVARAVGKRVMTLRTPRWAIVPIGVVSELGGRLVGKYPPLNREKAVEIRDACIMCSSAAARRDFGYSTPMPLEQGFAETAAWYREAGWL